MPVGLGDDQIGPDEPIVASKPRLDRFLGLGEILAADRHVARERDVKVPQGVDDETWILVGLGGDGRQLDDIPRHQLQRLWRVVLDANHDDQLWRCERRVVRRNRGRSRIPIRSTGAGRQTKQDCRKAAHIGG